MRDSPMTRQLLRAGVITERAFADGISQKLSDPSKLGTPSRGRCSNVPVALCFSGCRKLSLLYPLLPPPKGSARLRTPRPRKNTKKTPSGPKLWTPGKHPENTQKTPPPKLAPAILSIVCCLPRMIDECTGCQGHRSKSARGTLTFVLRP